jgi:hypothetical protein
MKANSTAAPVKLFSWGCSDQATATDKRNLRVMNTWLFVWAVVYLASMKVMKTYGHASLPISAAAMGALAVVPAVRAYLRFLRQADELTRTILCRRWRSDSGRDLWRASLNRS